MKIDDNKWLAVFTVVAGSLVLAYSTFKQNGDLSVMFGIFMATGLGYRTSKGIVDLKRDALNKQEDKEE